MEKLIRETIKNRSDKLEMEFPRADIIWKKIQDQQKLTNTKERKKRSFGIGGCIAAVLLIIIILVNVIKPRTPQLVQETCPTAGRFATQAEIEEAYKVASSFLTELYTIKDYNSFTKQDEKLYPNDNKTKSIRIFTSDKYYNEGLFSTQGYFFSIHDNLVPSKGPLLISKAAKNNQCNFQVDEVTITKFSQNMDSKNIFFHTAVHLKCKFKDGSEKPGTYIGDIIIKNENNKWLVADYRVTNYEPKEIFNNIYDKKVDWVTEYLLPHPYNPQIIDSEIYYRDKWPGIVMPEFTAQMQEMGWKLYDEKDEKKYYKKEINGGEEIKISIVVYEKKDPKEAFTGTAVIVQIEN